MSPFIAGYTEAQKSSVLCPGEGVLPATAICSSVPDPLPFKNIQLMLHLAPAFASSESLPFDIHFSFCVMWIFFSPYQTSLGRC